MKTKTNDLNGNPIICAGSYRVEKPAAQINWELAQSPRGPIFSASGSLRGHGAGQVVDAIAAAHPNDAKVQQIAAVWRAYHLNGMKTGTPEQMACLAKHGHKTPGRQYEQDCHTLKQARLYEIITPEQSAECAAKVAAFRADHAGAKARTDAEIIKRLGCAPVPYVYGSAWLYSPIPADVVTQIMSWGDNSAGVSFYDRQAADFLSANGIKFRSNLAVPQKPAPFAETGKECGNHYRVTLSGKARRLTFSFWGSIKDAEENKPVTAYSVLSCISSDANTPETFADFCAEYGYDSDSIKARDTFKRCATFARRIRAFFTEAELEGLAEIQ